MSIVKSTICKKNETYKILSEKNNVSFANVCKHSVYLRCKFRF